MNKKKLTSVVLSAAMVLGTFAGCAGKAPEEPDSALHTVTAAGSVETQTATGTAVAPSKEETVYVLTEADGTARQLIVSNWLKNPAHAAVLQDLSGLKDIENVKGVEAFHTEKNHRLSWDAAGHDIYYQGTTEQELPVTVKITYHLDGKPIAPADLAGKSGHVSIRFDYQNRMTRTATVNGRPEALHIPFLMATGILLDPEHFTNVTVKNGQMENLGNEIAVIGLGLPGMQENLRLTQDEVELPDFLEIEADTEAFKLGPTMTVATASLLEDFDSDRLDIQDLRDQAEKLTDGMNQLLDGAAQLCDGLNTLLEQTGILADGVGKLSDGATQLQTGADTLVGGVSQLQSGAAQLRTGLDTLNANSDTLVAGATQVFNTLLTTATQQLGAAGVSVPTLTIGNYADVLGNVIASLDENTVYQTALQQVTAGVEAKRGEIEGAVTAVVRQQVEAEVLTQVTAAVRQAVTEAVQAKEPEFRAAVILQATGMTPEQYAQAIEAGLVTQEQQQAVNAAVAAAMEAAIAKQMELDETKAKIAGIAQQTTEEKMASDEIHAIVAENVALQVEKAISETMASPEVQAKLQAAAEGAKSVIALKSSLDSYNGFYLGLKTYTTGVGTAAAGSADLIAGADKLRGGMDALSAGVNDLHSGLETVNEKMPQLQSGVTALRDGSEALQDGLRQLMDEGIQKIADLAEKDLTDLTARLAASLDLSYDTFSGKAEGTEGSVKFIFKTDSISAEN